jgi:NAD(P)-dependent dehydrogenase (short-subunit alcohol dehydrogenase family)
MTTRQQVNHFRQSVDYHFEGKVARIMGTGRGIGAATAQLFAQEGTTMALAPAVKRSWHASWKRSSKCTSGASAMVSRMIS